VAISCSANNYAIEIATLPPVARDDAGLMAQPHKGFDLPSIRLALDRFVTWKS
jgi:hypothetical protein